MPDSDKFKSALPGARKDIEKEMQYHPENDYGAKIRSLFGLQNPQAMPSPKASDQAFEERKKRLGI